VDSLRRLLARLRLRPPAPGRNLSWVLLGLAGAGLLAGLVAIGHSRDVFAPTRVRVDADVRHQTIDGWAVYPRYWEDDKQNDRFDASFEPHTERVSEFLVDELGINAVRVEIWSGLENPKDHWIENYQGRSGYQVYSRLRYEKINDNDDPYSVETAGFQHSRFDHRMKTMVLPIQRALEKRGEKLFVNVCYVDFAGKPGTSQGTLSHADDPDEFAEFVLVYFERLRDEYGIVPDSFEVILEPENTTRWRGREIGRAIVAVEGRLAEHGFKPRFVAPSNTSMMNAISYFDEMITVPGALERLDTFSYHRYQLERTAWVDDIWQRARRHGKKTAMLEKIGAGIDELFEDLTVGNVSGWQQWAVADKFGQPDRGIYYAIVDDRDPAAPRVLPTQTSRLLSQVFRYVRRGAIRIEATSDNRDKAIVAFQNPAGGQVVVVRAKTAGGPLTVVGLAAGRYGQRFVDEHEAAQELGSRVVEEGKTFETTIPAAGALAVYALPEGA
jgi:hypothetical protein